LDADGSFDGTDVIEQQGRQPVLSRSLLTVAIWSAIALRASPFKIDRGFTGVNAGYITCDRNDLNAVEIAVGRVITDDDSGASFSDFAAD